MRLAQFISANLEPIMAEWEVFARGITAGENLTKWALRDHAKEMLLAIVAEMEAAFTPAYQAVLADRRKSGTVQSAKLDSASQLHAVHRLDMGFDLMEVVAEYRALRASVLRLWRESNPELHPQDLEDLADFNDAVDQSLAKAVSSYTKKVDHARDMFLAILGHDLRSPLNSIAMSAAVLPRVIHRESEFKTFTNQIASNAQVMARMVGDLLDYTRTRLGAGMPVTPAPMDLEDLCAQIIKEFQTANPARKFTLQSQGDLNGQWDADRIRQAVSNLLGNAVQHGSLQEPICISLIGESSHVQILIHNSGPAIPPGEMAKIFEPLVQGAATGKPQHNRSGSIGLGLYIAREITNSHGGQIQVTSSDTHGTTFTVLLPRQFRTADAIPTPNATPIPDAVLTADANHAQQNGTPNPV